MLPANADPPIITITGAANGIGRAVARQLAAAGARLALLDHDSAELERAAAEVRGLALHADVTHIDAIARAKAGFAAVYPRCDALIQCAGMFERAPLLPRAGEPYAPPALMLDVNFWGAVTMTRAWWSLLAASAHPQIVFVSSVFAALAPTGCGMYAAGKAALTAYAAALDAEVRACGGAVSVLLAGFTRTALYAGQADAAPFPLVDIFSVSADEAARRLIRLLERPRLRAYVTLTDALLASVCFIYPAALRWIAR